SKSTVFVTGDVPQSELPKPVYSGLSHAMRVLASVNEIGAITLTAEDVVRNPLVKKIVKAYENEKENE
ncbi:MAG: PhoH family protein, partial [Treponemataceae bacterium]|nr:PhoH family protein [Treponemataceae bacterium]